MLYYELGVLAIFPNMLPIRLYWLLFGDDHNGSPQEDLNHFFSVQ